MVEPLEKLTSSAAAGAAGAAAVKQLKVLLAGVSAASDSKVEESQGGGGAARGGMVALEDLAAAAGGRHDNDHADYRDIKVMVTSEEVRCLLGSSVWSMLTGHFKHVLFGGAHAVFTSEAVGVCIVYAAVACKQSRKTLFGLCPAWGH